MIGIHGDGAWISALLTASQSRSKSDKANTKFYGIWFVTCLEYYFIYTLFVDVCKYYILCHSSRANTTICDKRRKKLFSLVLLLFFVRACVFVCVYFFPSAHRWLFIFIHCTHSPAIEIQLLNHVQKKHKVLRQTLHVIWLNSVFQTLHTDTIHKSWWDLTNKNEQKWKLFRIIITIKEMLHIFLCRRFIGYNNVALLLWALITVWCAKFLIL